METKTVQQSSFLYVEDEASNRQVMQLLMQKAMGVLALTIFEDSVDFISRVRALSPCPDVILLDIHVRPHNGFEMLNMLRADPQYHHITVIALTASVTNEEVGQLRSSGFDGAIGKPLRASTLPGLLARILKGETVWYVS